jgi:hypothetical protein
MRDQHWLRGDTSASSATDAGSRVRGDTSKAIAIAALHFI